MKKIHIIASVSSVIFFLFICFLRTDNFLYPVSYIPIVFGLANATIIKPKMLNGPGIRVAYFVMLIRYIVSPVLLLLSDYFSSHELSSNDMYKTTFLMVIEMAVILMTISFCYKKSQAILFNINTHYSLIIPFVFVLLSIFFTYLDPLPLTRYHFFWEINLDMQDVELAGSLRGLPRLLLYTHLLAILSLVVIFNKLYLSKKKKVWIIICLALTLFLSSVYTDTSRNSMLLPLLALMFLFAKLFSKYSQQIYMSVLALLVVSMSFLSMLKFYNTDELDASMLELSTNSILLERYFGGTVGVYECMQHSQEIKSQINESTFFTEVMGGTFYFGGFFNKNNRTSVFYNNAVGSDSFIIPTISEGFSHFGWFFCWVLSFVIIRLILLFDHLFMSSTRIDYGFIFAYISVTFGWMHPGNFIICMTALHVGFALLIVCWINSKFDTLF